MKAEKEKDNIEKNFTIDEVLGDAEWQVAQRIFLDNNTRSLKELKDLIQEKVVKDAMDMINYRTNQENDINYMSYLVTYALLTLHYQKTDRKQVAILNKLDYLGVHLAMNNPNVDPVAVIAPLSDDQIDEIFDNIFVEEEE